MGKIVLRKLRSARGNVAHLSYVGGEDAWPIVRSVIASNDDVIFLGTYEVEMPWPSILGLLRGIRALAKRGIQLDVDGASREAIRAFIEAQKTRSVQREYDQGEVQQRLLELGWIRQLRQPQLRDAIRLLSLAHGANFSVPGAGKTTVTFALHCIAGHDDWSCLVVAPQSAFAAWREVTLECLGPTSDDWTKQAFQVIHGQKGHALRDLLRTTSRIVTNYEHLISNQSEFSEALCNRPFHLIVDESHRMKSGREAKRGKALLEISDLPIRKDILSGTPAPQSATDFISQFEFLWNDPTIGTSIRSGKPVREVIGNLYVRTTKSDLSLEPPSKTFERVPMHPYQALLYAAVKDELVRLRMGIDTGDNTALAKLRKSVFTLLILMTNPLAAIRRLELEAQLSGNEKYSDLLRSAAKEGPSAKVDRCVELVEELVKSGRKALVWSAFRSNGDILQERLAHLDPLPMHGGIPIGDRDTPGTREHNRMLFHGDHHHVMIANPAACSEGMSLHKACHDAIYLDRTFNAAHYLQSIDRIHRLGLEKGVQTNVTVLQSTVTREVPSIDIAVALRMRDKIYSMNELLNDPDIEDVINFEFEASSETDTDADDNSFADKADLYAALKILGSGGLEFSDEDFE